MEYEIISGSVIVKNYSILHISGSGLGDNWYVGKDYLVEFVEVKPKPKVT